MKLLNRLIASICLLTATSVASAAGNGIGLDLIRMVDSGQYVGDSFNIFYQRPLSSGSAVVFTLALADNDDTMIEAAFKAYTSSYMSGVYYQAGAAIFDTNAGSDLGISGAIGYEASPAQGFVFFGAVKATLLPGNGNAMQYSPMLGAMFAF